MWRPPPSRASRSPSTSVSTSSGTSAGTARVSRLEIRFPTRVPSSAEVAAPHLAPLPSPSSTPTPDPICQPSQPTPSSHLPTRGRQMGQMWLPAGLCGPRVTGPTPENWAHGLSCPVTDTACLRPRNICICEMPHFTLYLANSIEGDKPVSNKAPRISMKRGWGLLPNGVGEGSLGR